MLEFFIALIFVYIAISLIISPFITADYFYWNITPFEEINSRVRGIETLGELLLAIISVGTWLFSAIFYLVVKVFYNRYTVALMNIRIRK